MKKIRHFVAFDFKDETSETQIKELCNEFRALKKQIAVVESFEGGSNVSPENLNMGFSWGFILTFKNAADRDEYLVHEAHKVFVAKLKPLIRGAFVFDFADEVS
jgi:hypothetical protein